MDHSQSLFTVTITFMKYDEDRDQGIFGDFSRRLAGKDLLCSLPAPVQLPLPVLS